MEKLKMFICVGVDAYKTVDDEKNDSDASDSDEEIIVTHSRRQRK